METNVNKKIVIDSEFESIIEINNHFFILNKKEIICVLPFTLDSRGLLDKIGVIENYDIIEEKTILSLISDYVKDDDNTNLVAANRLFFELTGTNITDMNKWMYLGNLYNSMTSDSPIKLYAVDITDVSIKTDEQVIEKEERKKFKMLDSSRVLQTDDILFLASYLRLFEYFYISSLK
jgi:hypothetical protein